MKINAEDYNDFSIQEPLDSKMSSGSLSPFTFLCLLIILVGSGLLFLYSASSYVAIQNNLPHFYYLKKQLIFALLGFALFFLIQKLPFRFFKIMSWPLIVIAVIFLSLTVFTPFGVTSLGATRWLKLPFVPSFQPSELSKACLILFLAYWFSEEKHKKYIGWFYVIPIFVILVCVGLILMQHAFTTSLIVFLIAFLMLLICGIKFRYLFVAGLFLIVPTVCILFSQSYRIKRVFSFLFPEVDKTGVNWQVNNSLQAISSGGLFGKGLGNGVFKQGALPEIESDFIFANIAEEQGMLGIIFVIGLFVLFAILGIRTYERAIKYSKYNAYLAFGVTCLITVQTLINLCVVLGLLPPTGIPLPFFSLGGTNLLILITLSGLLYKVMRENNKIYGKE